GDCSQTSAESVTESRCGVGGKVMNSYVGSSAAAAPRTLSPGGERLTTLGSHSGGGLSVGAVLRSGADHVSHLPCRPQSLSHLAHSASSRRGVFSRRTASLWTSALVHSTS